MRHILNCMIAVTVAALAGCRKEGAEYTVHTGSFTQSSLTASVSTLVLAPAKDNDTSLVFTWTGADFGMQPAVSYTLQLDTPADTLNNNWRNAKTFSAAGTSLRVAFTGKELNNLFNSMGLTAGTAGKVVARVKADVNQYNGIASVLPSVYSNVLVQTVTTYALDLYVPGDYQNWLPADAPKLAAVEGKPGLFEGYVYMAGSGVHYFKYTNAPDWNHTNYGDGGNGGFSTDGNAAGLSVPDGGYYYLTANLNNNTWTATKTTWGILGDATPGGWNTDTQLSYDATTQVWTVTAAMIKNGSFKFRANNAWTLDFGLDNAGKMQYADNPFVGYTPNLNNFSVPEDGTYVITLDLHVAGKYTYSLQKK